MKIYFLLLFLTIISCSKKVEPISALENNPEIIDKNIAYGKELVLNTSKYFGPSGSISPHSNGMNCTNCHLDAGTRDFGNNYKAVFANYPKFRERSGKIETLSKRINDCFQRSLNGDSLATNSPEIIAMISYINSVGRDVPKNTTPKSSGITKLKFLTRAADPEKGKVVYAQNCVQCHGANGEGLISQNKTTSHFIYPPLWGKNSYNVSAGFNRIRNLSGFIYDNMPNNTASHQKPILTEEQSWDVAAYIISKPRPEKFFKEDWPNIKTKPIDYAFGPYADSFSEKQHKFGPFQEIADLRKK
jgi:thiosulfate dehydrogenase